MGYIYKLSFESGDFYIGQTQDFERRIKAHISQKGVGSPKLMKAFSEDKYIGAEILLETNDMDTEEQKLIAELNPTLNTLPGGEAMRGLNSPRAKYSKEQIEECIRLFLETDINYTQISILTEMSVGTVHDILKRRSQLWATNNLVEELEAAKARRSETSTIYDPEGNAHEVTNPKKDFEELHGLGRGTVHKILTSGKAQGWTLEPPTMHSLVSEEGESVTLTTHNARIFLKEKGLSSYQIRRLLTQSKYSGGWTAEIIHSTHQKS